MTKLWIPAAAPLGRLGLALGATLALLCPLRVVCLAGDMRGTKSWLCWPSTT
jgi:hypothetical protein